VTESPYKPRLAVCQTQMLRPDPTARHQPGRWQIGWWWWHDARVAWSAPEVRRPDPLLIADERDSLDSWLDYHRATLLWKCAGLTPVQLAARPVATSALSLLGLVRHMAECERLWFRIRFAGEDVRRLYYWSPDQPQTEIQLAAADSAQADFAAYAAEIPEARRAVAGHSLDERFRYGTRGQPERDLRWVYVHMIEEYARHNGHADMIRELIDGTTGR
jgi:uncharacterized damage-inducible protein DinB